MFDKAESLQVLDDAKDDTLWRRISSYENSEAANDDLHAEFTKRTDRLGFLKDHRDWVERNRWGFGDRAFHYLWWLIVRHMLSGPLRSLPFLEIGVYKGQVLSLWALCAKQLGVELDLWALSPFMGNMPSSGITRVLKRLVQPSYRRLRSEANVYPQEDYLAASRLIFEHFSLSFDPVHILRGRSSDPQICQQVQHLKFAVIYIDGDHSLEGATNDLIQYSPLLERPGGILVMDDASCELPGRTFFKGLPAVSKAARIIPSLGFKNVLNVGHNRVYVRL